ncbi:hypothetical protein [Sphingobacterium mizutaii]|uniref:hypothetical protein n=1 Tax=Sphingobacterium mizutaii TaxID=1010 RepID=UPI00162ABE18|nr:hypothetical protein [Sphingobacterium mizutaii]
MIKPILISSFFIFILSCSQGNSDFERKSKMFNSINNKYKGLGFSGISDLDIKYKQVKIFSRIVLEKQNVFDSTIVQNLTDSLRLEFLKKHNISSPDFERDIDSVKSYSPTFLSQLYSMTANEDIFKSKIHDAYKANGKLNFSDLLFYFDNLYFKLSPDSKYQYVQSIDKNEIEKWMKGRNGIILEFENEVKKKMHDQESFEHIETSYSNKGFEAKVRMKYRGKNKLGVTVLNEANGILNTENGTVSITSIN